MSHLYLNEESDRYEENTCKNERKKLNILTPQLPIIAYSIRIENLDWCECQKEPLEVFCEKKCTLKFRKIYRENLYRRKHLLRKF